MSDDAIVTVAFLGLLAIIVLVVGAIQMLASWLDFKREERETE